MKSNPYLSNKEHRLLKILGLVIFILTFVNLGWIIIEYYINSFRNNGIDFTVYCICRGSFVPGFRIFSILLFPFIFWGRKYIFSTLITFFSFAFFLFENYLSVKSYFANNAPMPFLEFVGYIAKPLDYFVFLLVSTLLIWQISILFRIFRQISKQKIPLR